MNEAVALLPLPAMRDYFASGATYGYAFRKRQLQNLKAALYRYEEELYAALHADLKKNKEESWITELGLVVSEINHALKNLRRWMKPQPVGTNLLNFPSKSYVLHEPLGVVLIIGTWNYPVQLLLNPLVGAIAAGNCAVLKPSEFAPATAAILQKIADEIFESRYVSLIQGEGATVIPELMNNFRFDHVFYTGSTGVGTIIYEMAAKKLVPVTLELGGKCPCIVEKDADVKVAARRIAVTKFSNAGQMCVAPDYVLVHENIGSALVAELKTAIERFYAADDVRDYHYGKIVNAKQFDRLVQYIQEGTVLYGGRYDAGTLFVEPTLLTDLPPDAKAMQNEIFGPVLPIVTWRNEEEVYRILNRNREPLSFYVFTSSEEKANKWIRSVPFGCGCINNASWQFTNYHLPFGGRGASGTGRYHGRYSFETFSHKKGIMQTPVWFDPSFKYPPFEGRLKWFKKIIR